MIKAMGDKMNNVIKYTFNDGESQPLVIHNNFNTS